MICDFFGLREQPFGVTPDPRFWFASRTHREALASVLYGLEANRGFVALIAQPGMGKTTVLFNGLNRLGSRMRTVFLFQQITTAESLLRAVLADLGTDDVSGDITQLQRKLNDVCAEQARTGMRIVLVIDEAQNLDRSVLEAVRMLSNFETAREKLIQIVLSGQPQLAESLAAENMVQLRQRISVFAHLKPLSQDETAEYVNHRLRAAGYDSPGALFTPAAMAMIAKESQGIPRNINNLCFNAMSLAFALSRKTIDRDILREVVDDLNLESLTASQPDSSTRVDREPLQNIERRRPEQPFLIRPLLAGAFNCLTRGEPSVSPGIDITRRADGSMPTRDSQVAGADTPSGSRSSASGVSRHRPSPSVSTIYLALRRRISLSPAGKTLGAVLLLGVAIPILILNLWRRAPAETVHASVRGGVSASQGPGYSAPAAPVSPLTVTVAVKPGDFLESICTEHFVTCTPALLRTIVSLNPDIDDPNYLEVGQLIRIPAEATAAAPSTEAAKQ
jgi:general secretion pathway protein A